MMTEFKPAGEVTAHEEFQAGVNGIWRPHSHAVNYAADRWVRVRTVEPSWTVDGWDDEIHGPDDLKLILRRPGHNVPRFTAERLADLLNRSDWDEWAD